MDHLAPSAGNFCLHVTADLSNRFSRVVIIGFSVRTVSVMHLPAAKNYKVRSFSNNLPLLR